MWEGPWHRITRLRHSLASPAAYVPGPFVRLGDFSGLWSADLYSSRRKTCGRVHDTALSIKSRTVGGRVFVDNRVPARLRWVSYGHVPLGPLRPSAKRPRRNERVPVRPAAGWAFGNERRCRALVEILASGHAEALTGNVRFADLSGHCRSRRQNVDVSLTFRYIIGSSNFAEVCKR